MKRLICLLLALVMALSMLPVSVLADEYLIQDETVPVETIPEETVPEEIIPEETVPEEVIPEETVPEEVIPEETLPEETIPEETTPEETIPEETIPEETVPEETIPEEVIPEETIPEETIPEEALPEETIPKKNDAEVTVTASGWCGSNVKWTLTSDGNLTISGTGTMNNYNQYIESPWDEYRKSITSAVIEEGITSIGSYAFYWCTNVTSITIPNTVNSIGNHAFYACDSLNSIVIPNSITSIGKNVFANCVGLSSITLPESITSIGEYAFFNCDGLKEISLPENLQTIERYAFEDCGNLERITLPGTLENFGSHVFWRCDALREVNLSEGIKTIGSAAFYSCGALEEIVLPNSVTTIEGNAFAYCDALKTVTLPDGLTTIDGRAFYFCRSLESIVIPESVTSIGEEAFYCCDVLQRITLPSNITDIENGTFFGCSSLQEVVFSGDVTNIGVKAFSGCTNIESININAVTSIGSEAFRSCTSLSTIQIPSGVTAVNDATFYNCTALTEVILPENLQTIGNEAFYGCYLLTDIEIPDSVTSIGNSAFYDCESLPAINLPESLTNLGSEAFAVCLSLLEIHIPDGLTAIGDSAFYYCNNIITVTIPKSVTAIGENAFEKCTELRHVLFTGTKDQWSAISKGSGNDYLKDATRHYNAQGDEVTVVWDENGRTGKCEICDTAIDLSKTSVESCIILMNTEQVYNGAAVCPEVEVVSTVYGFLTQGTDYKVSYKNNKDVGYAKVVVTGIGNYFGTLSQEFYIFPRKVEDVRLKETSSTHIIITYDRVPEADLYVIYSGDSYQGQTTKTTFKDDDVTWGRTTQYTVYAYTKVGDYYFASEASEPFETRSYVDISLDHCRFELEYKSVICDGEAKNPTVTFNLADESNYTVSYENNVDAGKATVTITGVGKFGGTVKKTFKILPDQVQNLNVEMLSGSSVNISFDPVLGATEYWIYRNGERVKKITETSYTMTGLSAGKTYKFYVKANKPVDGENYTGAASETVSVKPIYQMEDCSVTLKYQARAYTGKAVTNTVTVKNPDGKTLKKDTDYKVSYENNKEMGIATMIITGKGKYAGQVTANYVIGPKQVKDVKVATLSGTSVCVTYDEMKGADEYLISVNGSDWATASGTEYVMENLTPGTKYTVTVSAGVLVNGEMLHGEPSESVSITPKHSMDICSVSLSQYAFAYTGKYQRPTVTVYGYNGEELTEGEDYTLSFKNNKVTGKAYVQVTGKGEYSGSVKEYYAINPAQVTGVKVSSTTKNSVKISFKKASSDSTKYYNIYVDGEKVGRTTGSSYTVKGLEVGKTYEVYVVSEKTVSGTAYYGEPSETIEVRPGTYIGGYKATLDFTKATFTGEAHEPGVVVKTSSKSSAKTLVQGEDYEVIYENNTAIGTAKVIITGIGQYAGTITKTFTINPPKVENVTAVAASNTSIQVSFDAAPGATSYWVYVNGEREAKITDTTCVIKGLKKNKTYKITVKSVATVDGENYTSAATDAVKVKTVFVPAE